MDEQIYNEQDIQDLAAGIYEGDLGAFEAYIKLHPEVLLQLNRYKEIFSVLNHEETPELSINLSAAVLSRLPEKSKSRESNFQPLQLVLFALSIVALFLTVRHFNLGALFSSPSHSGMLFLSIGIMLFFCAAFAMLEIKQFQRKRTQHSN